MTDMETGIPEEPLKQVDVSELNKPIPYEMIPSCFVKVGLITEQGFRIQGMGLVIKKLDRLIELVDKANLKLHYIEKKLER